MPSHLYPSRLGAVFLKRPFWPHKPVLGVFRELQHSARSRKAPSEAEELENFEKSSSSEGELWRKTSLEQETERKPPLKLVPPADQAPGILHTSNIPIAEPNKAQKHALSGPSVVGLRKRFEHVQSLGKAPDIFRASSISTAEPPNEAHQYGPSGIGPKISGTDQSSSKLPRLIIRRVRNYCVQSGTEKTVQDHDFLTHPTALDKYLEAKDSHIRELTWEQVKSRISPRSLSDITLHYIHTSTIHESLLDLSDFTFRSAAISSLKSRGLSLEHVPIWEWILSGDNVGEMVDRLSSSDTWHPPFVFSAILRFVILKVASLEKLINYAWRHLLPKIEQENLLTSGPRVYERDIRDIIEQDPFMGIIGRLLYHARRLWPGSMISITNLLVRYIQSIPNDKDYQKGAYSLDPQLHKRLSGLHNLGLHLLGLAADENPNVSMVYNWDSQKLLLQLASEFEPALLMDQRSYQAIIRVLLASKKTPKETKSAILRQRTWPPWRVEQDGIDAQRSPDDDLSRAVLAINRAREAGYFGNVLDDVFRIYGGQDIDGTPTIHGRKLLTRLPRISESSNLTPPELNPYVWTARIEATRDQVEAWMAFEKFKDLGGRPNLEVYLAMFKKLYFAGLRTRQKNPVDLVPGDGKEVLAVADDNFSDFYRSRVQPPSPTQLYKMMLSDGLQPADRCLEFLVSHIASTPNQAIKFLRDSNINKEAIQYLEKGPSSGLESQVLWDVPIHVFTAYIKFQSRFHEIKDYPHEDPIYLPSILLRKRLPLFRTPWYAFFEGITRRSDTPPEQRAKRYRCGYDELAWGVLMETLSEFHRIGLELNGPGFQLVCFNFLKYGQSVEFDIEKHPARLKEAGKLKKLFRGLSASQERPGGLPKLRYNVSGRQLFFYVMCMGSARDHLEILRTLRWMMDNEEELAFIAEQARSGPRMLRQTLVGIVRFLLGTDYYGTAKEWITETNCFGGFPSVEEVEEHIRVDQASRLWVPKPKPSLDSSDS